MAKIFLIKTIIFVLNILFLFFYNHPCVDARTECDRGKAFIGGSMLMRLLKRFLCLPPTTSVMSVKAALSLKDGGESWRVIGSSVTHDFVSDSDKSNNEGDAWSPIQPFYLRDLSLLSGGQSRTHAAPVLLCRGFIIQTECYNGLYSDSIQIAACS